MYIARHRKAILVCDGRAGGEVGRPWGARRATSEIFVKVDGRGAGGRQIDDNHTLTACVRAADLSNGYYTNVVLLWY